MRWSRRAISSSGDLLDVVAEGNLDATQDVLCNINDYAYRPTPLASMSLYEFTARYEMVIAIGRSNESCDTLQFLPDHPRRDYVRLRKRGQYLWEGAILVD